MITLTDRAAAHRRECVACQAGRYCAEGERIEMAIEDAAQQAYCDQLADWRYERWRDEEDAR